MLRAAERLKGGYALVIASPRKLIAVRDPWGIKPLCIGKRGEAYVAASESCALAAVGAEFLRDVEPGEIVTVAGDKIYSNKELQKRHKGPHAHCVFEYIYFARLDSAIDGLRVYDARLRAGRILARTCPTKADLVTGVPESGLTAARGYAAEAGLPFELAFYKNSYVGRTFIKPTQKERRCV